MIDFFEENVQEYMCAKFLSIGHRGGADWPFVVLSTFLGGAMETFVYTEEPKNLFCSGLLSESPVIVPIILT